MPTGSCVMKMERLLLRNDNIDMFDVSIPRAELTHQT